MDDRILHIIYGICTILNKSPPATPLVDAIIPQSFPQHFHNPHYFIQTHKPTAIFTHDGGDKYTRERERDKLNKKRANELHCDQRLVCIIYRFVECHIVHCASDGNDSGQRRRRRRNVSPNKYDGRLHYSLSTVLWCVVCFVVCVYGLC